ncbi:MAG: hypothetical protein IIW86_03960 [Clostridia bacterium]|jgi:hypothetical protein|nr:hypothetical protein [Clostridia bacterium]
MPTKHGTKKHGGKIDNYQKINILRRSPFTKTVQDNKLTPDAVSTKNSTNFGIPEATTWHNAASIPQHRTGGRNTAI